MLRKLTVILLSSTILLLGVIPALAAEIPSPSQYNTLTEYEKATGKKIEKFNEAPMLRVKVAAGELPPVEQRLPKEPVVIMPVERIGQYGGTWRRAWMGPKDQNGLNKIFGETVLRADPANPTKVIPNIFKGWEISDGGKVYTFYLRKGMRWSDGAPFTADDVMFVYEDIYSNKELYPVFPKEFIAGGKPGKLEKIDDYTIRISFASVYGNFLNILANGYGYHYAPKHYLKQFHPRYTPKDELEKKVKEAGFDHWYELFSAKRDYQCNKYPEHPTLNAWMGVSKPTSPEYRMERNPYFWKIDPEGNQLPYIDCITNVLVENPEMINMKAVAGELDFQNRRLRLANYTLFIKNQEKGNYRVLKHWRTANGSKPALIFNFHCKDPVLRKLFRDDRFRKALSLAINREEFNELCYSGLAVPRQASIPRGGAGYLEEWEKAYAEYDPEKANALLDEIGLKWDENHKYRLRPDGRTLTILYEYSPQYITAGAPELIKSYWEKVGVKVLLKEEDDTLLTQRLGASEFQVYSTVFNAMFNLIANPARVVPVNYVGNDVWWQECGRWYRTKGKTGEKPTGDVAKLFELWEKIRGTPNHNEQIKFLKEIAHLHAKNIWYIGTVGEHVRMSIARKNLRNIPEHAIIDDVLQDSTITNTVQYFFEQK